MNKDEVYSPDGALAGQIIRRPAAPDQASSANAEDRPGGAADHAGVAIRVDNDTVARSCEDLTNDRVTPGHSVATETVTTHSGRETTYHLVAGQPPTTVAETATVALRERLRLALRRHIDPDDDTMPALDHDGFVWVPVDGVIADLVKATQPQYPIATHPYQGEGYLHPCTAVGFGSMCGSTQWDHMEEQ